MNDLRRRDCRGFHLTLASGFSVKYPLSTAVPRTSLKADRLRTAVFAAAGLPSILRLRASNARRTVSGSSSSLTGRECRFIQSRACFHSSGGSPTHAFLLNAHEYNARRRTLGSGWATPGRTNAGVMVASASASAAAPVPPRRCPVAGGGILDHLVVLLDDQAPADRPGQGAAEPAGRAGRRQAGTGGCCRCSSAGAAAGSRATRWANPTTGAPRVSTQSDPASASVQCRSRPSVIAAPSEEEQLLSWE